jgi:4'-phosphopantetheinyl transferase
MIEMAPGHIHLWLARDAGTLDTGLAARYAALLSAAEQARWQRFIHADDRERFLLTRALARTVLAQYVDEPDPARLVFTANDHGKPALVDVPAVNFNLSHTKGLVALAVTRSGEIGVDVEAITRRTEMLKLAARYFSAVENRELLELPPQLQRERFFRLWTLKEAYVKAKGLGLRIPLDSFSFDFAEGGPAITSIDTPGDDSRRWHFRCIEHLQDFRIALALELPEHDNIELRIHEGVPLQGFELCP